jgi:hypothetical protein
MAELIPGLNCQLIGCDLLLAFDSGSPLLVWEIGILLFIGESSMDLILLDNLLELVSIDALPLVVTKDHSIGHFRILWILLLHELFHTVAVDVKFLLVA